LVKINKTIERFKSKSILVTGANGFVGSFLIPELLRQSYLVKLLLRKSSPKIHFKCKKFRIDNFNDTKLEKVFENIDVVIHLAGRVHVMKDNEKDPLAEYRKINVDLTRKLAQQAASSGVKRLIFISSIKVNGELTEASSKFLPDEKSNPQDAYAVSKKEAELALFKLAKETGMEVVIIRPPLIYGPGAKANFLSMMKLLHKNLPLPFDNIKNKRSLVYVRNLVSLISRVISHPKAAGQIFLVSDDCDVSTTTLLKLTSFFLGKKIKLFSLPVCVLKGLFFLIGRAELSQRLLSSLSLDISKTKQLLGWLPPYSFEDAIKLTAEDFLRKKKSK
jgi:nucleoside-diphosphate-sugar epimerase